MKVERKKRNRITENAKAGVYCTRPTNLKEIEQTSLAFYTTFIEPVSLEEGNSKMKQSTYIDGRTAAILYM